MIAFLCNGYQDFIKKAVMEIAHDKEVGIVIGDSCPLWEVGVNQKAPLPNFC